jgi:hypothetical protein
VRLLALAVAASKHIKVKQRNEVILTLLLLRPIQAWEAPIGISKAVSHTTRPSKLLPL